MIKIKNITIINEDETLKNMDIVVNNNKIISISKVSDDDNFDGKIIDGSKKIIVPGFIDTHIHGSFDFDFMDENWDALEEFRNMMAYNGVTSVLGTTITNPKEKVKKALKQIKKAMLVKNGANIIGAHFEGPYIDISKKGAQPEKYIRDASISDFQDYENCAPGVIKKVSYSPKQDNDFEFIEYLSSKGIIGSLAHSNANYQETLLAVNHGLSSTTHTLNAMTSFKHSEPGAFGAVLDSDKINAEFIVDGMHVSFQGLKHIFKIKDLNKITVITDAMRAAGTSKTKTDIGGQAVDIINNHRQAVLENTNTLAGSVALMIHCFKNLIEECGLTINQAVKLTSTNQAMQYKLNKGRILPGYDAELVILDENFNLEKTIINDKIYIRSNYDCKSI